eukprot:3771616-Rhodomonas_salina.2
MSYARSAPPHPDVGAAQHPRSDDITRESSGHTARVALYPRNRGPMSVPHKQLHRAKGGYTLGEGKGDRRTGRASGRIMMMVALEHRRGARQDRSVAEVENM